MRRQSSVSRGRRQQIAREARQFYPLAMTRGLTVDQIQGELLSRFPSELAPGEARMYAMGWTAPIVREGLLALAAEDQGRATPGLELIDVNRWLRGQVRPTAWLPRLCRLFRCHQAHLGWPPQGNEVPVDFTPRMTPNAADPATASADSLSGDAGRIGRTGPAPFDDPALVVTHNLRDIVGLTAFLRSITEHIDVLLKTRPLVNDHCIDDRLPVAERRPRGQSGEPAAAGVRRARRRRLGRARWPGAEAGTRCSLGPRWRWPQTTSWSC